MQRREFLGTGCAAGAAAIGAMATTGPAALAAATAGAGEAAKKQVLEWRLYRLDAGAMRQQFEKFLADAAIPAFNRIGARPVGVFGLMEGTPATKSAGAAGQMEVGPADLYVLLPHESAESLATAAQRLAADAEYQKAGAAVINAEKAAPAYKRIETWLMLAFDAVPRVEAPTKKESRIFQLRTYESHSDAKAAKKMEMFNTGGELAVFRRSAMNPVFFGQTLAGTKMPNLTYMLGFDDADAQKAAWDKFGKDPEWTKLSTDPQYKDTVSNITNIMLKPAACSQI